MRTQKRLTQSQLAARLGVTKSVISAYETSARYPSYDILIQIAQLFSVSTDYLLGLDTGRKLDIAGLSPANQELVCHLVQALKQVPYQAQ